MWAGTVGSGRGKRGRVIARDTRVEVDGHRFTVTNLSKVLYPATGTSKADVIGYYAEVAAVMLPHLLGRPVTRKRWPNGVDAPAFFQKNIDRATPDWIPHQAIEHRSGTNVYPIADSPAALAWLGQNAALEIHVPQWRFGPEGVIGPPDRVVFDLDPGPGVELADCAEIAVAVRDRLARDGRSTVPVTSGSKGIHLYARLDGSLTSDQACDYAHTIARELEARWPDRVLSRMTRALRAGKIFLDWSQNNANKTTIAPYSLRGRDHPTVAAPRDWDEITDPELAQLDFREVAARVAERGDLMAALDGAFRPDKLSGYRSKRSADRTPEPVPPPSFLPTGQDDTFVLQEHHARALHWDFRLERGGVLVSWAVPKGIPTDTRHNRLAVQTEDHPLEYADFAGRIPSGEYGGGWVTVWDSGNYRTEKWRDDEVIVILEGEKATGRFALIRTKANQWLMHRTKDQPDLPAVVALPESAAPPSGPSPRPDSAPVRAAAPLPEPEPASASDRPPAPATSARLPVISPMLATAGCTADLGSDHHWRMEGKWDGVRAIVTVAAAADGGAGTVTLTSRNRKEMTATYPELAEVGRLLTGHTAVLDGEIVALDSHGRTDFATLQQRMKLTRPAEIHRVMAANPVLLFVFDVLFLDGVSLLDKKFDDRRRVLEALPLAGESVRVPAVLTGPVEQALAHTRELDWEGLVAKTSDSTYQPGRRSPSWVKIKNFRTQEVVVVGWRPGSGRRAGSLGSLLLALPDPTGWRYVGRVGSGFSDRDLKDTLARLKPLARKTAPVTAPMPRPETRDARWVTPQLVGEVRFTEWSRDGLLRQATWRGFRPDKVPAELRLE